MVTAMCIRDCISYKLTGRGIYTWIVENIAGRVRSLIDPTGKGLNDGTVDECHSALT